MKLRNFFYWGVFLLTAVLTRAAEDRVFHGPDGSVSGPDKSRECQSVELQMQSMKKDPWINATKMAFTDSTVGGDLGASWVDGTIGAHPAKYMHTPNQDTIALQSPVHAKTLQEAKDACNAQAPRGQWKLPSIANDVEREVTMRLNASSYRNSSGEGFGAIWIDGIDPNDPNLIKDRELGQKYPDKKDWVLTQSGVGFSQEALPIPHAITKFNAHIASPNKRVYGTEYKNGLKPLVAALGQGPSVVCVQSRKLPP